jgi:5-aminolevulinate synthase
LGWGSIRLFSKRRTTRSILGVGAGGTRNISGTSPYQVLLERELADLSRQRSGPALHIRLRGNRAMLATLGREMPVCIIYSDAHNHASMIQGIRRSGAEKHIYRHNDASGLEAMLAAADPSRPKLVCFESVYSMDGDIAPIAELCDVAERHSAMTYLDEVHAVGSMARLAAGSAGERAWRTA